MEQVLVYINDVPQCDVGAPTPVIYSDESYLYLFYYLSLSDENWDGTYVKIRNGNVDEGVSCIKFEGCIQYKFGDPNDEAIEGHPLYKYGLSAYAFFEVMSSEWINTLMEMNRVHPYHKDEHFSEYKHFIYFFHDNCFEVVCKSYTYDIMATNIKEAVINIIRNT